MSETRSSGSSDNADAVMRDTMGPAARFSVIADGRRLLWPWLARLAVLIAALSTVLLLRVDQPRADSGDPCAAPITNQIACENSKPGTPRSVWDVTGDGDPTIQGFATDISVNHGATISFKINTDAAAYKIDIYRLGWYGGDGARLVATIDPTATLPQVQPQCLTDSSTGLIDCGNWSVSASWDVPADAVSGVYLARPERLDTGGASHIPFIVRDDGGHENILLQTSDTTWQAYNDYGGNSLYVGNAPSVGFPEGRAYKVSYNRPFNTRANDPTSWVLGPEFSMIQFLERNGYDLAYSSEVDTARFGSHILDHKIFMTSGHDEYWSGEQRANVQAARDAGVNLAFFTGNEMTWKTRWESSIDDSATPWRTLVCYKESAAHAKIDPSPTWTGNWRDSSFSPPSDGGRPENQLTGQLWEVQFVSGPITVPAEDGKMRFWRNTSVADLSSGQTATLAPNTLGYEWDVTPDNGVRPSGEFYLSTTTMTGGQDFDTGQTIPETHHLSLYRAPSGSLVFGAGTIQWAFGLAIDGYGEGTEDSRMQQATVNLLADMGAQSGTLMPTLVAASKSTDVAPPTTAITSPAPGATLMAGNQVVVTGTAGDTGGGTVAAVEVSLDGGDTWHPATGRGNWTYTGTLLGSGLVSIEARSIDDSANMQSSPTVETVYVSPGGLVGAWSFNEGSGSTAGDASGNGNTGTISNAAWTGSGKFGHALIFNGTNARIDVPNSSSLQLSNGMTLEAWVDPSAVSNRWGDVIYKGRDNYYLEGSSEIGRAPAGGGIFGGGGATAFGSAALPANTWSYVATTYDGTTLRFYVDGTLVSSQPAAGMIASSTNPLQIGGDSFYGQYFNGAIDEVRVYNNPLSSAQIQADMTTPIGGTADTQPPSQPGSLAASVVSASELDLSWAASSDNVGVSGYRIERCQGVGCSSFAQVATTNGSATSYADTGLSANTSYSYRVRAVDAAGNLSPYSATATATTQNTNDTQPPSVPTGLTVSVVGQTSMTLSWNASTDNVGVTGYRVYVNGSQVDISLTTSYLFTNLVCGTSYTLGVAAVDFAGNVSAPLATTVGQTGSCDSQPPSQPGSLAASVVSASELDLSWAASSDNVGVSGYRIERCQGVGCSSFAQVATTNGSATSYADTGLSANTSYSYRVRASDAAGNLSPYSATATATTQNTNDTQPPSVPTGLTVSVVGQTSMTLSWNASTDNVGVTGYRVYVNGSQVDISLTTSYLFTNLVCGTSYTLGVAAVDFAGNVSAPLATTVGQTGSCDSQPPSQPGSLAASVVSASELDLSWAASSDNVGVSGYRIERCQGVGCSSFAQVATTNGSATSYADTGLSANTSYSYRVRAVTRPAISALTPPPPPPPPPRTRPDPAWWLRTRSTRGRERQSPTPRATATRARSAARPGQRAASTAAHSPSTAPTRASTCLTRARCSSRAE